MSQDKKHITKVDIELPNGQFKQMIITKKEDGKLKSVEDESGNKFLEADAGEIKISHETKNPDGTPGHFRSPVVSVRDGSVIVTQHNPTCGWYFFGGRWYWLCW